MELKKIAKHRIVNETRGKLGKGRARGKVGRLL